MSRDAGGFLTTLSGKHCLEYVAREATIYILTLQTHVYSEFTQSACWWAGRSVLVGL